MIEHLVGKKVHVNDIKGVLQKEGDFYKVKETFHYFIGESPIEVCKVEIAFIEQMVEEVTSTTFKNTIRLIESMVKEK